ncbi:F-box only protein 7-like isoform X2 [Polistes fuscatus]|uniref:F-box only protein 7-like isoform X2 n=1 Tax=Polistes fuscatus TaxID=30207 RepID=UPI001CA7E361|nr:F-box only protein 7-like isoform X2 [Polistes fuscatus]
MSVTSSLSLEDYLGKLDETTTQNEYFLALFVVLFSECGFYLLEETSFGNNKKLQFIPPSQWMVREDTYEIKLVLRGLPNMVCKLIAISCGDILILNFFSTAKERNIYSLAVKMTKYINPFPRYLGDRFMNLKELSDRFKNELVMGVRSDILTEAGITNPSLKGLPIELKFKILAMLDARSLTRLSQCSHQFNMLCKEPWLWQRLLEKDFGEKSHENWLMAYRTKYMESKTRMINIEHMFNHRPGYASAWSWLHERFNLPGHMTY